MEAPTIGLPEAAQSLRIANQDAHRLVLTGVLRARKLRGRWYVDLEDLGQLLDGQLCASFGVHL